jgi:DNA-binding CsgD family transcriptional regulator
VTQFFSTRELDRIASAVRVLTDPFGQPTVDGWRLSVNRELKELFNCSSVGFLLPGTSVPMLSEEHDPEALAGFPDLLPPPLADGTPIWKAMIDQEVCTVGRTYGLDDPRYYRSDYYLDYAAPNRARETMAACFAVAGFGPSGAASLHFWNDRTPPPERFVDRDVAILRILFPAFQAGVRSQLRLDALRGDVHALIDSLNAPVMVCDEKGRIVHETPALADLLRSDADAISVRAMMAGMGSPAHRGSFDSPMQELRTAGGRYRLSMIRHPAAGGRGFTLILAERPGGRDRTAAELQGEFGLTPAESQVAVLLAKGMSNSAICSALSIAESTARRHTERVLAKLRVRSRSEIPGKVRGG